MNRETYYTLLGLGRAGAPIKYVPINFIYNTTNPYGGWTAKSGAQQTTNTQYFTFYYQGGAFNTGTVVYESGTGANVGVNPNTGPYNWYQTVSGVFWLDPNGDGSYTVKDFEAGTPVTSSYTCVTYNFNANQGFSGTASWLNCVSGITETYFLAAGSTYSVCARAGSAQGMPYTTSSSCTGTVTIYTSQRTKTFYRNNCGPRYGGNAYSFTRYYTSIYSQADAYNGAMADTTFEKDGQAAANANATCSLYNITTYTNPVTLGQQVLRFFETNVASGVVREMVYTDYPSAVFKLISMQGQVLYDTTGYQFLPVSFEVNSGAIFINGKSYIPDGTYAIKLELNDGSGRILEGGLSLVL